MIIYRVDPDNPDAAAIAEAADAIRRGELVVFPTETVYGLAADALNEQAVERVFEAKGRSESQALPIQIASASQLPQVTSLIPGSAAELAERYWPGPLTLVLPKAESIPSIVSGGKDTVGVRVPDHPVALALLKEVGTPIVATSANLHGREPATSIGCAVRSFGNLVTVALDAGSSRIGVASTVVDVSVVPPRVLRRGALGIDEIRDVLGEVEDAG